MNLTAFERTKQELTSREVKFGSEGFRITTPGAVFTYGTFPTNPSPEELQKIIDGYGQQFRKKKKDLMSLDPLGKKTDNFFEIPNPIDKSHRHLDDKLPKEMLQSFPDRFKDLFEGNNSKPFSLDNISVKGEKSKLVLTYENGNVQIGCIYFPSFDCLRATSISSPNSEFGELFTLINGLNKKLARSLGQILCDKVKPSLNIADTYQIYQSLYKGKKF